MWEDLLVNSQYATKKVKEKNIKQKKSDGFTDSRK
jgi:hypothetical protein